jgi:hypothetical protein
VFRQSVWTEISIVLDIAPAPEPGCSPAWSEEHPPASKKIKERIIRIAPPFLTAGKVCWRRK